MKSDFSFVSLTGFPMSDIIRLMTYTVDIRQRRQVTLPGELLLQLGVSVGDALELKVEGSRAILKPKRQVALEAFEEIKKAFRETKISEKELIQAVAKQRQTTS